jgi:hypothetical protein
VLWTCLTVLALGAVAVIALQQPSVATFPANAGAGCRATRKSHFVLVWCAPMA